MKPMDQHKAVITVVGNDSIGIIAKVSTCLSDHCVNINDITQTILEDVFTMIMIVDLEKSTSDIKELDEELSKLGQAMGLSIRIQHAGLFNAMHRI